MIVKKIKNPKKSASKTTRISALADYILSPVAKDRSEKCVFAATRGVLCDDLSGQKKEMIALSTLVRKSADTVNHYVISLQAGEHPTQQQFEEIVTLFTSHLGWKDHQVFAGLHRDTENHHIHLAINRVHPVTEKVVEVNKGMDIELAHQAIAIIEKKQGWRREKNGLYCLLDNGKVARSKSTYSTEKSPGQKQQEMEVRTGEKSVQRIVQEKATDILSASRTWSDLHEAMSKVGFRYEKFGSGAKIFVGDIAVKASDVQNGGLSRMEKRLGPFQPAIQKPVFFAHTLPLPALAKENSESKAPDAKKISESKAILEGATSWEELHTKMLEKGFRFEKKGSGAMVFLGDNGLKASEISRKASLPLLQKRLGPYLEKEKHGNFFAHTPKQDFSNIGNSSAHGVPKLSERRLAYSSGGRIAGILQIDALPYRSKLDSVRWEPRQHVVRVKTEYIPEPLRSHADGWKEYSTARLEYIKKRKLEIKEVDTASRGEMEALRLHQKSSREKYRSGGWNGRGVAFSAFRSMLAALHAAQKIDLVDRQRARKEFVMMNNPDFPTIEQWQRSRGRNDLANKWRANRPDVQDIVGDSDAAPQRRDIRDFSHKVDGDAVHYYKREENGSESVQIGFVDLGRRISVHDWRDEETTLAALQLASQKFGKFAVTGTDDYKQMCVKLAVENGFEITNPELQDAIAAEKLRISEERQKVGKTREFQEFEKYHAAVGADRYRISATKELKGEKSLFLVGENGVPLKGVVPDRVAMKMGEMIHLAGQGQKIELGPLSKNLHHFVVHGITQEKLDKMQSDGYQPSAIVKTGDGLHTAVINMRKWVDYDAAHGVKVGKLLADLYGSGAASGSSHAAPGFFQAELIKAVKTECTKIVELARKVIGEIEARRAGTLAVPVKLENALDVLSAPDSPSSRMLRPAGPRPANPKVQP